MPTLINVTIPVLNEAKCLAANIERLRSFLDRQYGGGYELVIADNGSTDQTLKIAHDLERQHPTVRVLHLDQRGRGRALRKSWTESRAEILSYMDVDLSADLEYFPLLIEPLVRGTADVAIGSRLLNHSLITRGLKREIISRGYNRLVKLVFRSRFSDAQCGFKALTRSAADALLPLVKDNNWFFDTELLLLAERNGFRIHDVPVRWADDPDTRVKFVKTAVEDLKGLFRVWRDSRHS